jgi:hypothetical protein
MNESLAQRILRADRPFVLFHTHSATRETIEGAIASGKSMDLDICVDEFGAPYLGHSREYYRKSGEVQPETMPFEEAIELVSKAQIPVIVDCKHHAAWPAVENAVENIGAHRCLVHSFAAELKFGYQKSNQDYITEWSPIRKLTEIKNRFPLATITASCKFLPDDLLLSSQYHELLTGIREVARNNQIDTVCLNVPDNTVSDEIVDFFLKENIIPHIGIDNIDISRLSRLFIGETDILEKASNSKLLGY